MRQPEFADQLTADEFRHGIQLASQQLREYATQQAAQRVCDETAAKHHALYRDGKAIPPGGNADAALLPLTARRAESALWQFQSHCRAIAERLKIKNYSRILDFFRVLARPVEPIPLETLRHANDIGHSRRRNQFIVDHDAELDRIDAKFLAFRDDLTYDEALQQLAEKRKAVAVEPQAPRLLAPPPVSFVKTVENAGESKGRNFFLPHWANVPINGISQQLLNAAAEYGEPPRRKDTLRKFRNADDELQHRRLQELPAVIDVLERDLETTDEHKDPQAHTEIREALKLTHIQLGLAEQWFARSPAQREPEGRLKNSLNTAEGRISTEIQVRAYLRKVADFLDKRCTLAPTPTRELTIRTLQCADYCGSRAHQNQIRYHGGIWKYRRDNKSRLTPSPLDLFKSEFIRLMANDYQIPLYVHLHWGNCFELVHALWFDRLNDQHHRFINERLQQFALAQELKIRWAGQSHPQQWEWQPHDEP